MTSILSANGQVSTPAPARRLKLGEMLIQAGLLSEAQLQEGLAHQRAEGSGRLGASLVGLGYITEEALLDFLAKQLGLLRVDLDRHPLCAEMIAMVPAEKAREFVVMPIDQVSRYGSPVLLVAMTDPTNFIVIDALQFMVGCRVEPVLASERSIRAAIDRYYGAEIEGSESVPPLAAETLTVSPPSPAEQLDIDEKLQRLLKILLEKGILSLRDVERLK
jgi:hypothetical protein